MLTQLATWALGQGMALDAEVVFDPDTIERFVAVGLAQNSSRATYRADLRRVAPLLTKFAPGSLDPPYCHEGRWHLHIPRLSLSSSAPMGRSNERPPDAEQPER